MNDMVLIKATIVGMYGTNVYAWDDNEKPKIYILLRFDELKKCDGDDCTFAVRYYKVRPYYKYECGWEKKYVHDVRAIIYFKEDEKYNHRIEDIKYSSNYQIGEEIWLPAKVKEARKNGTLIVDVTTHAEPHEEMEWLGKYEGCYETSEWFLAPIDFEYY